MSTATGSRSGSRKKVAVETMTPNAYLGKIKKIKVRNRFETIFEIFKKIKGSFKTVLKLFLKFSKNSNKNLLLRVCKVFGFKKMHFWPWKKPNRNFCQARMKIYDLGWVRWVQASTLAEKNLKNIENSGIIKCFQSKWRKKSNPMEIYNLTRINLNWSLIFQVFHVFLG